MGGGGTEGPATKLIGNLLARPQAGVGGWGGEGRGASVQGQKNACKDRKIYFPQDPGNEKEICEVGGGERVNS